LANVVTWDKIANDPDYINLPDEEKRKVKEKYFQNVIAKDPDYLNLPDEEKEKVRIKFLGEGKSFLQRLASLFERKKSKREQRKEKIKQLQQQLLTREKIKLPEETMSLQTVQTNIPLPLKPEKKKKELTPAQKEKLRR